MPKNIVCEISKAQDGNMDFRFGGRNEVLENRTLFLERFGIAYQEHIAMWCDHGDVITLIDDKNDAMGATSQEEQIQSEVLVTQKKHLALMLFTADCRPSRLRTSAGRPLLRNFQRRPCAS
jgi:copper oxidase (laccase) domain-containing protein